MHGIQEIDSRALVEMLQKDPEAVRLIDVRSVEEMAQGMIAGGEAMPLHLVPLRASEIMSSDRPVVLYCRSGARSAQAAMFLVNQGGNPERIINLRGGIMDWVRQGNHVVAPGRTAVNA